jgi:uroporphyrinogen decarboxylase
MDSSRNLIRKTLEFDAPSRVPRDIWTLPWANIHYPVQLADLFQRFPNDIQGCPSSGYTSPVQGDPYELGTYIDEWGSIFYNNQRGVIGEVKEAAIPTWEDLPKLRIPVERLNFDVDAANAFCRTSDKFVMGGCCPRPFERAQFLRTSAQLFMDLAEQPPELFELIHTLHEFYLKELDLWAKTEVDGLMFMDDWGAQSRLLISPKTWRKIFKPLYKDYIDIAHAHGKKIFMHSDGYTADIIPDLVELGLDAINSQLFCMDIEELGRQFCGKITFWGEIDRQHLLPFGTPADVEAAVRRVYQNLYHHGGCIAQCEFGAGSKPENVLKVYETWQSLV